MSLSEQEYKTVLANVRSEVIEDVRISHAHWQSLQSPRCGYECDNYDGRGFFGQKISMVVCLHCHIVQSLTVGGMIAEIAPSFSTEYGRLCPKCNGKMLQEGKEEFWT